MPDFCNVLDYFLSENRVKRTISRSATQELPISAKGHCSNRSFVSLDFFLQSQLTISLLCPCKNLTLLPNNDSSYQCWNLQACAFLYACRECYLAESRTTPWVLFDSLAFRWYTKGLYEASSDKIPKLTTAILMRSCQNLQMQCPFCKKVAIKKEVFQHANRHWAFLWCKSAIKSMCMSWWSKWRGQSVLRYHQAAIQKQKRIIQTGSHNRKLDFLLS